MFDFGRPTSNSLCKYPKNALKGKSNKFWVTENIEHLFFSKPSFQIQPKSLKGHHFRLI